MIRLGASLLTAFFIFHALPLLRAADPLNIVYSPPRLHLHEGKETGKDLSRPFIEAAKKATPCVVFIQAEGIAVPNQSPFDFFNDDFFNRFFGISPNKRRAPQTQTSRGSGFLVSSSGHILTNYHVVRGAKKITVLMQKGGKREVVASLVGGDERADVAMIKIAGDEAESFPYLEMGDSDNVEVGEWVLAIGNPFQLEATVTSGIISAKGRQNLQITDWEDFLQTDAPINPGNSGGPLIDLDGRVIGMNTAIVSSSGGYMGIGFAIPSNMLKNIKEQLMEGGTVARGFLGVSLQPVDFELAKVFKLKQTEGALVVAVSEGSPAAEAGLKLGDLITHIDGHQVESPATLRSRMMLLKPKTRVILKVIRQTKTLSIPVVLGSYDHRGVYSSSATASHSVGITIDNLTPENIRNFELEPKDKGVVVVDVQPNSPADQVGISRGSVIMAVNHREIANVQDFDEALESEPDKHVLMLVKQGAEVRFVVLAVPREDDRRSKRREG